MKPLQIYYCYAPQDKKLRDELEKHLIMLKRLKQITLRLNREIVAGTNRDHEEKRRFQSADLILLLISPDFMSSNYHYEIIETYHALEKHKAGNVQVIPVLLRPTFDWEKSPIGKLQALPRDGKAITERRNRDAAFTDVVKAISEVVAELLTRKQELAFATKAGEGELPKFTRIIGPLCLTCGARNPPEVTTCETCGDLLFTNATMSSQEVHAPHTSSNQVVERKQISRRTVFLSRLTIAAVLVSIIFSTLLFSLSQRGTHNNTASLITHTTLTTSSAAQTKDSALGRTWHAQHSGTSQILLGVTWSEVLFVAVGISGTILTSPDGRTWTAQHSGTSQVLESVTWSGVLFVVVGGNLVGDTPNSTILTSSDGHIWTVQNSSTSQALFDVAWSGHQFASVGTSGTILTSPDGRTWTLRNSGTSQQLESVIWSDSLFVVVGTSGTILTSPDGRTWTAQHSGTSQYLRGIAWSGHQFVAVGDSGTILTSPDGRTWTLRNSGTLTNLRGIASSGSLFVVVSDSLILASPDGRTWTVQHSDTSQALNKVVWSNTQFVSVGFSGIILASP